MSRNSLAGALLAVTACAADGEATPFPVEFGEACDESDCAPEIPMTGRVSPAFVELDIAMRQFMKHRCVGAAVLSVSLRGRRVYKRGFGRMLGPAARDLPGCNDGPMTGFDPYVEDVGYVRPDTPITVGSVTKFVTAAMVRPLVAARIAERGLTDVYPTPTHARVFDPALGLMPSNLIAAVQGDECGPVTVDDLGDCTRACGASGPDVRWRDVTIGDLLAHTAGLWSSAAAWNDWVAPNLGSLRGYTHESDYAAEDAALRARYPEFAADLERTRAWLADNRDLPGPIYFPSRYDVRLADPQLESLGVILTRCLARDPAGTTDWEPHSGSYSNTDFTMLGQVVSHLGAGGRYAAETGHPDTHDGSQLDVFLAAHGIDGGVETREGIFARPIAWGTLGWHPPTPQAREWLARERTYTWLRSDYKRPFCVWTGDRCDFSWWIEDPSLRPSWNFESGAPHQVPLDHAPEGLSSGTGGLAVEAPALLELTNIYAVGNDDVTQGRPRVDCGDACDRSMRKNGAKDGAVAWITSLPGGLDRCNVTLPDAHGRLTVDGPATDVFVEDYPGVDFAVIISQSGDGREGSTMTYAMLDDVVRYGLSRVDWARVEADLADQATTVIGFAVDERGDTHYWSADDSHEVRMGPPQGPGRGPLLSRGPFTLPATRIGPDVLAVARALDRDGDEVVAWYDDGHASVGTITALGSRERSLAWIPAAGHVHTDLAAAAIRPDGQVLAVYRDGTTSRGTLTDLGATATVGFGLPAGQDPHDLAAIALDGDDLVLLDRDGRIERTPLTELD
jgi:CubicO group peptidase (beta-lactamase class C family)